MEASVTWRAKDPGVSHRFVSPRGTSPARLILAQKAKGRKKARKQETIPAPLLIRRKLMLRRT